MSNTDLATLTLFPATKEQIVISRKRTFPHWGRGLTEELYLARDAQLDCAEHARDKFTTWVLAPRDDRFTLNFKCACETYKRTALIHRPGSSEVEEIIGYGIASVFTPPQHRKKGYARYMMRLLHWVLAPRSRLPQFPSSWGAPPPEVDGCGNASFSALYSDVGPFYQSCGPTEEEAGWVIRDPVGTVWDSSVVSQFHEDPDVAAGYDITWLGEQELDATWKKDVEHIKLDLIQRSSSKTGFTFLPHEGVAAFLTKRTIFFLPGQTYNIPTKWGVHLTSKNVDRANKMSTFATWTLDVKPPPSTLIVTRIRTTLEAFPALLKTILVAARANNMEKVEIWNLPPELVDQAHKLKGITETRDEHLNAFKWYGPEKNEDVEWLLNEKFCWC